MEKAEFGSFVAQNRRELGLTQKTLAERLHVTDKAVSKWERGLSYPDVTLLEPLAAVFGLGVTELVSCRRREDEAAGEEAVPPAETPLVQGLLAISWDSIRKERTRRWRWVAVLALLLLAALGAVGILLTKPEVSESGTLIVLHTEERGGNLLLFTERDGHLLRLAYTGTEGEKQELAGQIADGYSLEAEYRWSRRTWTGKLLNWHTGGIAIGTPMDEVGSSFVYYDGDGDLFGYPRICVKILSRQPNPRGPGYLSTYVFTRGGDGEGWLQQPMTDLLTAANCLGYGGYGDGGYRIVDMDGDGIHELLTRTPWPEKPCILYELTEAGIRSTWLDELPEEMTGMQG